MGNLAAPHRGRRVSWVVVIASAAFIVAYLAKVGGPSYARSAVPARRPVAAPALVEPEARIAVTPPSAPQAVVPTPAPSPAPVEVTAPTRSSAPPATPVVLAPTRKATTDPMPEAPTSGAPPPAVDPNAIPADAPRIKFAETEYDFGSLFQRESASHEYTFENVGKSPLKITNIVTICACSITKAPRDPIPPGGKSAISVTFEAGLSRGPVVKHLFVESTDPAEPRVVLTLKGKVKLEVEVAPSAVYFGRLAPGATTERSVVITPVEVKQVTLREFKSNDPAVTLVTPLKDLKPAPDGSYTLTFRIGPYPEPKRVISHVTVRTDLKHQPELPIAIYGRVSANAPPQSEPPDRAHVRALISEGWCSARWRSCWPARRWAWPRTTSRRTHCRCWCRCTGKRCRCRPESPRSTLAEARRMYEAQEAPFLDARQPAWYQQGHIPGARNLPADDFETRYLDMTDALEAAPVLVVYCESADCGEALATVGRLKEAYRGEIRLYVGGWLEWTAAGYPTRAGDKP